MKFNRPQYENEGSAPLRESALEIGDHGFILELVMKDMYSDPISAICREIASNCRDAHREIGTPDRPIEVQIPNAWEQEIKFKDYGPGISPSRMDDIYTKLGRSTKRDSNTETGGFGLGAKTPFAYTSQFSIYTVSRIQTQEEVDLINIDSDKKYTLDAVLGKNIKCTYTASRGASDNTKSAGGVKLHTAELTNEPTGTEIIIAVNREDTKRFIEALTKATFFWSPRPIINGDFTWPENHKTILHGSNWRIVENTEDTRFKKVQCAVIDGIQYNLQLNYVGTDFSYALSKTNLFIEFNTGDVELVPSRESIQYDERTIDVIKDRLTIIESEIYKLISDKIANEPTYKDAIKAFKVISSNVISLVPDNYKWNGNKLYTGSQVNLMKPEVCQNNGEVIARLDTYSFHSGGRTYSRTNKAWFDVNNILVINDVGNMVSRDNIQNYIESESFKELDKIHILVCTDGDIKDIVKNIKTHLELDLEVLDPVYLSDYAKPREKTQRLNASQVKKYEKDTMQCFEYSPLSGAFNDARINKLNTPGYYVIIEDKVSVYLSKTSQYHIGAGAAFELIYKYIKSDIGNNKIYGFRRTNQDKICPTLLPLEDLVKTVFDSKNLSDNDLLELKMANLITSSYDYRNNNYISELLEYCNNSVYKLLLKEIENKSETYTQVCPVLKIIGKYQSLNVDKNHLHDQLENEKKSLYKKYPLIEYLNRYDIQTKAKIHVKKYIDMIDAELENKIKKAS